MTVGTAADTNITKTASAQHARAPLVSDNGVNMALAACKLCSVVKCVQGVLTRTKGGNVNTGGPNPEPSTLRAKQPLLFLCGSSSLPPWLDLCQLFVDETTPVSVCVCL